MITDKVILIFSEIAKERYGDIEPGSFSVSELDSVTYIKIVVAIESEFDIEFGDEMLLTTVFPTILSMAEYVESRVLTNKDIS